MGVRTSRIVAGQRGQSLYSYSLRRAIQLQLLLCSFLVPPPVGAQAVLLSPGKTVSVSPTSLTQQPELAGAILQDVGQPFVIDFGGGRRIVGTVQVRVLREEVDGTLDFYYHLKVTENTALGQCCNRLVVGTGFSGVLTEVGARTDGLGALSPLKASRSPSGDVISFDFSPGLLPADESLFFFIRTDATTFKEGDRGGISQGELRFAEFLVFSPVVDPMATTQ